MINAIEPKPPPKTIDNPNEKQQRGQQKRKHEAAPEAAIVELSHEQDTAGDGLQNQPSTTDAPPEDRDDVGNSLDVTA